MDINRLKQLNIERVLEIDEAVALSVDARMLADEYGALGLEEPEWLTKVSNTLREEIAKRTRAADLAKLKELEREIEGYKTVTERRSEATRRLAELQKKMGMTPARSSK